MKRLICPWGNNPYHLLKVLLKDTEPEPAVFCNQAGHWDLFCLQSVLGLEPGSILIRETRETSSTWELMPSTTAKYYAKLGESCEGGRWRLRGTRGIRDTTRTWATESIDQDLWRLSEIGESIGVWPRSLTYMLWLSTLLFFWDS